MQQPEQTCKFALTDLWEKVLSIGKKLPTTIIDRLDNEEYQYFLDNALVSWEKMVACYRSNAGGQMDHGRTSVFMYDCAVQGKISIEDMMLDFTMFPRSARLDILKSPLGVWTLIEAGYPADKMVDCIMSGDFTPADKKDILSIPATRAAFVRDGVKTEEEYAQILISLDQEKKLWREHLKLVK